MTSCIPYVGFPIQCTWPLHMGPLHQQLQAAQHRSAEWGHAWTGTGPLEGSILIMYDHSHCFALQDILKNNIGFSILLILNQQPSYYHSVICVAVCWFQISFLPNVTYDIVESSDVLLFMPTDCDPCNAVHTLHYPVAPSEGFRQQFVKGNYTLNMNIFNIAKISMSNE